ncbi:hypothetical protein GCM10023201_10690 [Actinomycetospora corticicola]
MIMWCRVGGRPRRDERYTSAGSTCARPADGPAHGKIRFRRAKWSLGDHFARLIWILLATSVFIAAPGPRWSDRVRPTTRPLARTSRADRVRPATGRRADVQNERRAPPDE